MIIDMQKQSKLHTIFVVYLTYNVLRMLYIRAANNLTRSVSSKVTTPQDAHEKLVLQDYLSLNTLEFSAV